ncbi:MAG: WYL domain-containing protein [Actinobacteria bacterium]|nr:WYL domain-containing protein [Actinomycetota bacterium]
MTDTPPPAWAVIAEALRQRHPLSVSYHGHQRTVCPHALGWKNGRPMLLAYQTGGHTTTGRLPADPQRRWRNLFVDEIDHVALAEPTTNWDSADNYNPARPFNAIDTVSLAIPGPG